MHMALKENSRIDGKEGVREGEKLRAVSLHAVRQTGQRQKHIKYIEKLCR